MADRVVLITGATGKQGGATLRHLANHGGFKIRAMTRKPEGAAAKAVAALGAEVVSADLDDSASLERALAAVWGVFSVQNTYQPIPMEAVRQHSDDMGRMLEWFDAVGYSADIPSLETTWGIRPRTLKEWALGQR